jgi:2-polyprenyl-3-methyl-5-hydroxy-6-metoxy-1,4-benzoquinol methylase
VDTPNENLQESISMLDVQQLGELFTIEESVVSALDDPAAGKSQDRLKAWARRIGGLNQFGVEYLLPRIRQEIHRTWPPFTQRRRGHLDMSLADLRAVVEQMRPWSVPFPFGDGIKAIQDDRVGPAAAERILYRRDLICKTVATLLGSDAANTSVLDIGCNLGFFSLDLADRGVGHVQGIDLRPPNVARAQFLAEHFGVDNVEFAVRDVDTLGSAEQWDVVLNLGVLYHVVNPLQFIRQTYELCRRFAIIDTVVHREPVAAYFLVGDRDVRRPGEGRESYELRPTYRAAIETIRYAGFREVVEIVGDAEPPHELYEKGECRCFLAIK